MKLNPILDLFLMQIHLINKFVLSVWFLCRVSNGSLSLKGIQFGIASLLTMPNLIKTTTFYKPNKYGSFKKDILFQEGGRVQSNSDKKVTWGMEGFSQTRMSFMQFLFITNFEFFHSNCHCLDKMQKQSPRKFTSSIFIHFVIEHL